MGISVYSISAPQSGLVRCFSVFTLDVFYMLPYLKGAPVQGALKGALDPMGQLSARTRWATYW